MHFLRECLITLPCTHYKQCHSMPRLSCNQSLILNQIPVLSRTLLSIIWEDQISLCHPSQSGFFQLVHFRGVVCIRKAKRNHGAILKKIKFICCLQMPWGIVFIYLILLNFPVLFQDILGGMWPILHWVSPWIRCPDCPAARSQICL